MEEYEWREEEDKDEDKEKEEEKEEVGVSDLLRLLNAYDVAAPRRLGGVDLTSGRC